MKVKEVMALKTGDAVKSNCGWVHVVIANDKEGEKVFTFREDRTASFAYTSADLYSKLDVKEELAARREISKFIIALLPLVEWWKREAGDDE